MLCLAQFLLQMNVQRLTISFQSCSFGLSCHVDWLVEASVSELCAVSILRAENGNSMLVAGFPEMLASTNQSRQQCNPKENVTAVKILDVTISF
jgi:hypothetical protein